MAEAKGEGFPHRDADGRIVALPELLGMLLAGLVIGLMALVVVDWALVLAGRAEFGRANGWLTVVLPAWLLLEEFRAWGPGAARFVVAPVAAAVGLATGLLVAGLADGLAPIWSGGIAGAASALTYGLIWFPGVRWLTHRTS
jgi:hypothetical protein